MTRSIPIPTNADIIQYDHIQCVHPKNGLVMRAHRIVIDAQTPVRWTREVEGPSGQWRDPEWTMNGTRKTFTTAELKEFAKNAGFGEWQQLPIGEGEGVTLIDGEEVETITAQYQEPDKTSYPVG